jgi:DNA invertase Pin-like site-specific DNA recombinase
MISERTKAALAAANARGVKLGNYWKNPILPPDAGKLGNAAMKRKADARAADIAPIIAELQAGGATSLRAIAGGLNERGVPTPRGGIWSSAQVMRVLARGPASSGPFADVRVAA